MKPRELDLLLIKALQMLVKKCPRLVRMCYWAGTSAISLEELHHRHSFDLDFHTTSALVDVRPILAELQLSFRADFEVISLPDEFGSGFRGLLKIPRKDDVVIEVLSNFEAVSDRDLVESSLAKPLRRISLERYLADKIQCIAERVEARDLFDISAILRHSNTNMTTAKRLLRKHDKLILAERLLSWSDEDIIDDLKAYEDIPAEETISMRDQLLDWLRNS